MPLRHPHDIDGRERRWPAEHRDLERPVVGRADGADWPRNIGNGEEFVKGRAQLERRAENDATAAGREGEPGLARKAVAVATGGDDGAIAAREILVRGVRVMIEAVEKEQRHPSPLTATAVRGSIPSPAPGTAGHSRCGNPAAPAPAVAARWPARSSARDTHR